MTRNASVVRGGRVVVAVALAEKPVACARRSARDLQGTVVFSLGKFVPQSKHIDDLVADTHHATSLARIADDP